MLIRPAVVVNRRHKEPAVAVFTGVALGDTLTGWIAIDDDHAKVGAQGKHEVIIEARPTGGSAWTRLFGQPYPHKAGMLTLELPTGELAGSTADVRVVVTSSGKRPPAIGFDLDLDLDPGEPAS
jgi:hypothetical protein